ncbi:glycosyltransferase family 4 protein [Ochrobactrum sp. A-1]|nr:glycosyltransferase family 4 protein [Ochrobactrum sp. A-1]
MIVHVIRQFLPNLGGLEDVVSNLARKTIERGFRVRVITLDSLFTEQGKTLPAHEYIDDIEVVRIPWIGSSRYPIAPQVFRHLDDADVVHVHAIDFFYDALSWGRLFHRKPMVVTTHGGFFHTNRYSFIKKLWFQSLTRVSALGYRKVIGCSVPDVRRFSEIAPERTILIDNGADIGKFANCASSTPRRRIVTIGRFSTNKRLDNLLETVAVLRSRHTDWHIDVIGVESDLTRRDLVQHIERLGLEDAVSIHVAAHNDAIGDLIGNSSIFASASDYEGFGIVALEAMSAGLLPVLNANAAYSALAERHMSLRLTNFNEAERAADDVESAFGSLMEDCATIRENLIAEVRPYLWDVVADKYMGVYCEILDVDKTPLLSATQSRAV